MDGVLTALAAFYGPLAPPPTDLFAFFVWEIVSARALPARRDIAWQALRRIPALTPDAMFRVARDDLKAAINGLGGFDERLDALRAGSGHFRRHRDLPEVVSGPLLRATRALRDVPHLSPAAQVRALFFAGGHTVPAVDDEVGRVVGRLARRDGGRRAAASAGCPPGARWSFRRRSRSPGTGTRGAGPPRRTRLLRARAALHGVPAQNRVRLRRLARAPGGRVTSSPGNGRS